LAGFTSSWPSATRCSPVRSKRECLEWQRNNHLPVGLGGQGIDRLALAPV